MIEIEKMLTKIEKFRKIQENLVFLKRNYSKIKKMKSAVRNKNRTFRKLKKIVRKINSFKS